MTLVWIQLIYLFSTALFILSLKWMSHPATARRGIVSGVVAMVAAVGGTVDDSRPRVVPLDRWGDLGGLRARRALGDGSF